MSETIKLQSHEWEWFGNSYPNAMASFYETCDAEHAKNTKKNVEENLIKVLQANKWLTGNLTSTELGEVVLDVPHVFSVANYIKFIIDDQLFSHPISEFSKQFRHYVDLKRGKDLLNGAQHLIKLYYVENSKKTKLVIVLAISHVIADGWTEYQVWKMLNADTQVISLSNTRDSSIWDTVKEKFNFTHPKDGLEEAPEEEQPALKPEKPPRIHYIKINKAAIQKYKEIHNKNDFFVSTNDIIMSVILGKEIYQAGGVHMAVNMRGKLDKKVLALNEAGNYNAGAVFSKEDMTSPKTMREAFKAMTSKVGKLERKPVNSMATNWAHNYHQLELNGYKHCIHTPVFLESVEGMTGMGDFSVLFIAFMADKEKLAVYLLVNNDVDDSKLYNHEIVEGTLF